MNIIHVDSAVLNCEYICSSEEAMRALLEKAEKEKYAWISGCPATDWMPVNHIPCIINFEAEYRAISWRDISYKTIYTKRVVL